ncbi:MFS general substrate transporter [Periconia macrospinosa]|uniref:MFS general substrate transporter n=1 Tax=Periconia macrospinosa TaxID=97972 RepID=A0A2V1E054_9PLEO|nr:MFS general substrate transporter [Periconia macrospinosa]
MSQGNSIGTTQASFIGIQPMKLAGHQCLATPAAYMHREHDPEQSLKPKKPYSWYLAFFAINISTFVVSLDATALSVAVPKITQDLNGTTLEAFWTNLTFILAVVVVQPLYTSVSDAIGRKIPFYVSFILFFAGSLAFALAKNMAVLITGRLLQGLGGGGLDVLSEIILVNMTSLKQVLEAWAAEMDGIEGEGAGRVPWAAGRVFERAGGGGKGRG